MPIIQDKIKLLSKKPTIDSSQGSTMSPMPVGQVSMPQGIPNLNIPVEPRGPSITGGIKDLWGSNEPLINKIGGTIAAPFIGAMTTPQADGIRKMNAPVIGKDQFGQNQYEEFDIGKNTTELSAEVGSFIQNKAPGLDLAKQEGRYLSKRQLDDRILKVLDAMPDATDEEIAQSIGQLKNQGYFFEGMNDRNFDNPVTNFLGETPLGFGLDLLGGAVKGLGASAGGIMSGAQEIATSEGDPSKMIEGGVNYGMGMLGLSYPLVTSAFNTEAFKPIVDNSLGVLQEGMQKNIVNKGLDLTGLDPNSEEYQRYSNALSTVGTVLTTMGVFKGGKIVKGWKGDLLGRDLNYNNVKVSDFIKNTGKTAADFEIAIKKAKPDLLKTKITNDTPLSKIFTPEEYAQMEAMAQNNLGATGTPRREGVISDATQAKYTQPIKDAFGNVISRMTPKKGIPEQPQAQQPKSQGIPKEEGNAVNSEGTVYTQENVPGKASGLYKKVFTGGDNVDLAGRAVSPSTVKKTPSQKINAGAIALTGLQRLHNDSTNGYIDADISTMEGGVEGLQQAKQYHGQRIGEITGTEGSFNLTDALTQLDTDVNQRGASISPDLNAITNSILKDFAQFGPDITIQEAQQVLSTIKSNIFSDPAKIKQLSNTISGSALNTFIKSFEESIQQAIDDFSGKTTEFLAERKAYNELMSIEKDLLNSYVVEVRNLAKKGGLSNSLGEITALLQFLKNPSLSSLATGVIMKTIATAIGKGKTRNAAYERLIENFKREDIERANGKRPLPKKKSLGNKFETDINKLERKKALPPASEEAIMNEKTQQPDVTPTSKVQRPTTPTKKEIEATKQAKRDRELKNITDEIASATKGARYGGTGNTRVEGILNRLLLNGKITREEAIEIATTILEDVKEKGVSSKYSYIDKPKLEQYINDLYSNKKIESWDDLLNEKQVQNEVKTPRQEFLETPEGIYREIQKKSNDRRFNPDKADDLIAKFKEKTGIDLMKDPFQKFDENGNVIKSITKEGLQKKVDTAKEGLKRPPKGIVEKKAEEKALDNVDDVPPTPPTAGLKAKPEPKKEGVLTSKDGVQYKVKEGSMGVQKKEPKKNELTYNGISVEVNMDLSLNPDELAVQQKMLDDVRDNIDSYMEKWDKEYGNQVSADEAKSLSPEFSTLEGASKYSRATHEVASAFTKLRYKNLLAKNKTDPVIFLAGGSGVGKTTAVKQRGDNLDSYAVVYDTNLNTEGGVQKVEQAIKNGNPVEILFIYRDIFDAFENGVLPRAERIGRVVPIVTHIGTHKGSYEKILELTEKYRNSNISIEYIDNSRGKLNSKPVSFDEMQNIVNFPPDTQNRLIDILEKSYKEGKISKRVYDGLVIPKKRDIMELGKNISQKSGIEKKPSENSSAKPGIIQKLTESPDNAANFRAKVMMEKQKFRNSNIRKNGQESINTLAIGSKTDGGSSAIAHKEALMIGGDGKSISSDGSGGSTTTSIREGGVGGGKLLGKKGRAEINIKSKEILESKNYSMNASDYTREEKDILRQYTGAGGKASEGATGRGLLDEYYTPAPIVDAMWDIVKKETEGAKGLDVLEPTVGVGRFIENAPEYHEIYGMEIDKTSGTIAKILNPSAEINIGDFQTIFMDNRGKKTNYQRKYNIIIGNPPYGPRGGIFKGLGEESSIGKQEDYFIKRGIDLLYDGGILTFIVPSGFLKTAPSNVKTAIHNAGGKLINAYRLPEKMFEDTAIGTDILVFKKGNGGDINMLANDKYFEANPEKILGTVKTRMNKFGKEEQYVDGDKESVYQEFNKNKVGISKKPTPETTETKLAPKVEATEAPKAITPKEKPQQMTMGDVIPEDTTKKETPTKLESKTTTALPKKSPKKRAEDSKEVTVSGIKTNEYQIVNGEDADAIDIDIYTNTGNNGVVEYRKEWEDRINYYNGQYIPDILYYSGDTYGKLDQLEADKSDISPERYNKQLVGLQSILPKPKTILDINFDPLSRDYLNIATGETRKTWTRAEGNTTIPANVNDLFKDWLEKYPRNLIARGVYKGDITGYINGDRQRNGTKEITGEIHSEARRLYNIFMKNNLPKEAQEAITDKYNREKNSYVAPQYSKIPVPIKGMATEYLGRKFEMSDTQQAGLGFLTTKRVGLVAYGVGVGKTHTLLISTVVNMQKGNTKRPIFFVPGSTLQKTWIDTAKKMFPGVEIKNLGGLTTPEVAKLKKQFGDDPKNWIKDGEITFMTHKGILKLGFTPEEIAEITGELTDVIGDFDDKTDRAVQIEIDKMQVETGKALRHSTDINFTDLGFDHISVDEVHNFRKVFTEAKVEGADEDGEGGRKRFGKLDTGGTPSLQARKLFILTQMVQKATGGNVFLASATPFENKATEIYNILSFMARDRLKQLSIFNLNDFISLFADLKTEFTYKMNGDVQDKEIMKSYANKQELHRLMQEFIDFQEDPTLVRPEKVILTPQLRMSPKQEIVKAKIDELLQGVTRDEGGAISAGEKALGAELKASTYGKSYSISPFYVSEFIAAPKNAEEFVKESPKIEYAMEMARALKSHPIAKDKGIFMYIGKEGVGFTDMFVDYLVNNIGYTKDQIGVIKGGIKDEEKELIKEKYNDGRIKVLIGGDNTKEGIDLQNNGYVTINLALGWNPTEMMQVSGRQWRQGNSLDKVLEIYPLVENSSDIGIFQKVEEKAARMKDSFSYSNTESFDIGDIDPMEQKLILVTDPVKKAALASRIENKQLEQERVYKEGEMEDLKAMKIKKETLERTIPNLESSLEQLDPKSWQYSESRVKTYKDEIAKSKRDLKNIEDKLQTREIKSIDEEVAKIQKEIEGIEQKKKDLKENEAVLIEKYTNEYLENLKNTKTMENHISEIKGYADKIKMFTPEELVAKKEVLKQKVLETKLAKKGIPIKIETQGIPKKN